jgi:hypothetical protein
MLDEYGRRRKVMDETEKKELVVGRKTATRPPH